MSSLITRRVKIVGTLGPTSSSEAQIGALIDEGLDYARLNFSHGDHAFHRGLIQNIRAAAKSRNKRIGILQDLQGPKLRVGLLPKAGVFLEMGAKVCLYPEGSDPKQSTFGVLSLPLSREIATEVCKDVQKGQRILFDDGKIATKVLSVKKSEIMVEVEVGGLITSHKGMNLPDTPLTIACLTTKDLEDLAFGIEHGVDAVALSFVREPQDILTLRQKIKALTQDTPLLIPKIERREAVEAQEAIMEVSDGLLIARGDMAVELGAECVPSIQKQLIYGCNQLGVPVITATQMLESMIHSPTPTRAEASDVANAVFDGTDAVMLSGETASGEYPKETVRVMARIIAQSERDQAAYSRKVTILPIPGSIVDAIESSAAQIAERVGAVTIACITHSGSAAKTLAKYRPHVPICAIMDEEHRLRRLNLTWGIQGVLIPKIVPTDDLFAMVEKTLLDAHVAAPGDLIVVTGGIPTLRRGTTNMVKVHRMSQKT